MKSVFTIVVNLCCYYVDMLGIYTEVTFMFGSVSIRQYPVSHKLSPITTKPYKSKNGPSDKKVLLVHYFIIFI